MTLPGSPAPSAPLWACVRMCVCVGGAQHNRQHWSLVPQGPGWGVSPGGAWGARQEGLGLCSNPGVGKPEPHLLPLPRGPASRLLGRPLKPFLAPAPAPELAPLPSPAPWALSRGPKVLSAAGSMARWTHEGGPARSSQLPLSPQPRPWPPLPLSNVQGPLMAPGDPLSISPAPHPAEPHARTLSLTSLESPVGDTRSSSFLSTSMGLSPLRSCSSRPRAGWRLPAHRSLRQAWCLAPRRGRKHTPGWAGLAPPGPCPGLSRAVGAQGPRTRG